MPNLRFSGSKAYLTVLVVVLLAAAIFAGLELTGVTHVFHKKQTPTVAGGDFNSKGEKKTGGTSNSASANQSSDSNNPGSSSYNTSQKLSTTNAVLLAPSGDFVSNHSPNLSGSPAPNTETSVCNTTPGASCKITFTKSGVTKSLPAQTADPNGFVSWNSWKLQDIGLSAGSWKIQAIASLNGQTKTASDALDLVVAQ